MAKKEPKYRKLRLIFLILLLGLVAAVSYAIHAGFQVSEKMSRLNWNLPARVYAQPKILFPGMEMSHEELQKYFQSLGYVEKAHPPVLAGQFAWRNPYLYFGQREFEDAVTRHGEENYRLEFRKRKIEAIRERDGFGKEVFTLKLEPRLIGHFFPENREDRTLTRLEDFPPTLPQAILLMEDRDFYDHHGVSIKGILRALYTNLIRGGVHQGGSTLTQQLMKNFFLTHERTLSRKIREAVYAVVVDLLYSKDEILEAYMNEIYLGQRGSTGIHGFGEAARFYFGRNVRQLSLAEQASLVALISSPGRYSPFKNPDRALERRNLVLKVMFKEGVLPEEEYEGVRSEPLEPRRAPESFRVASYFLDHVRSLLQDEFDSEELETSGLKVFTTLDDSLQRHAHDAVTSGLEELEKQRPNPLQAALLSIHPETGAIRAWIGGKKYSESQYDRVKLAKRQVGSSVKPFVAALALGAFENDNRIMADPTTRFDNRPAEFSYSGRNWAPRNYDDVYTDPISLREAIERSMNVATVNIAARAGLMRLQKALLNLGFEDIPPYPSIALGAFQTSPYQLTKAYTVFPSGGFLVKPRALLSVVRRDGQRLAQDESRAERLLTKEGAFQVTAILQGVVERGTARSIRAHGLRGDVAGKTGTTDEYRDSWFVGYSPTLLTAVWIGNDENLETGLTGASGALQIWIDYMKRVFPNRVEGSFKKPKKVEALYFDEERNCVRKRGGDLKVFFLEDKHPPEC